MTRKRDELPPLRLPHSDQTEQSLLGSLMIDPSVWDQHARQLDESHFYSPANRTVWNSMRQLMDSGVTPDLVTVSAQLENAGQLSAAGGIERLTSLADIATAAYIENYVVILEEYREMREAAQFALSVQRAAAESDIDQVRSLVSSPPRPRQQRTVTHTAAQANQRLIEQLRLELSGQVGRARTTGIPALDGLLTGGGFRPGQLIVVAGRPSMGKSVLSHNFLTASVTNWGPGLFCAMEMSCEELQERALSAVLGENPREIMKREGARGLARIEEVMPMTEMAITYDDSSTQTVEHIMQTAERITNEQGHLSLIVIDYLQLIESPKKFAGDPVHAIGEISKRLKQLARKLEVPIVLLSQLSRAVEKRPDKRPMLSDLRDSGSIEQDADIVIFIYRDHYYNRDADPHETELIIPKQRGGPTGVIKVDFNQGTSVFVDKQAI